jgi:hypothetical protein
VIYAVIFMLINIISACQPHGVMVSMLESSVVDRSFEPGQVKSKTMTLVFGSSALSTHHLMTNINDWLAWNQCYLDYPQHFI